MSVTLDHVTRSVDGMATIRDVSLTLERGTLSVLRCRGRSNQF
jgi:glycerol transport system ATP-binding protein